MGADRRGGALPCAGLRHGLLGADAADPGAADDRRLPGGHPGRVRLTRPACAPSAGNGPADRSFQPHEAFDGGAGDHPAGEKRDGAGAPPPEDGSSGITEPDGAQPLAAAAQPDRPPFPFQHPERHFTDRRTGKSLPHAGPHHGSVAPAALQPDEQRRAGAAGPGSAHRGRVLLDLSRPLRRPGEDGVAHLRLPRFDGDDGAVLHLAAHRGECLQARHLAQGRGRRGAHPHQPAAG